MHNISFKNNKHHQVKSVKREIHLLIHEILKFQKTNYEGVIFLFVSLQTSRKRTDNDNQ